jgi:hypothetical protein
MVEGLLSGAGSESTQRANSARAGRVDFVCTFERLLAASRLPADAALVQAAGQAGTADAALRGRRLLQLVSRGALANFGPNP